MSMATLTSKGQITVPVEVRTDLGLEPGSKLDFRVVGPGRMEVTVRTADISDLFGAVPNGGRSLSIAEIEDTIGDAAAEQDRAADS
ncbi:MAG: AbrB/MazE/SpoVT family DNA-binding domain-containing protein [Bifidobacteriaceae bacterium]|jgi:AbrB family looped-hinge helix DNA binding protein|nr:AbrB/MazE/SpoVT family DNA-binding domain-containing protein [Bifidobacteriaceae bacterium]